MHLCIYPSQGFIQHSWSEQGQSGLTVCGGLKCPYCTLMLALYVSTYESMPLQARNRKVVPALKQGTLSLLKVFKVHCMAGTIRSGNVSLRSFDSNCVSAMVATPNKRGYMQTCPGQPL